MPNLIDQAIVAKKKGNIVNGSFEGENMTPEQARANFQKKFYNAYQKGRPSKIVPKGKEEHEKRLNG